MVVGIVVGAGWDGLLGFELLFEAVNRFGLFSCSAYRRRRSGRSLLRTRSCMPLPRGSRAITRSPNNAGGLEAGMTNSQPLVLRAAMKPISTLARPLESVNLQTKQSESASYERSELPRPRQAASWRTSSPSRSPAPWWISSAAIICRKSCSDWTCFTRWHAGS